MRSTQPFSTAMPQSDRNHRIRTRYACQVLVKRIPFTMIGAQPRPTTSLTTLQRGGQCDACHLDLGQAYDTFRVHCARGRPSTLTPRKDYQYRPTPGTLLHRPHVPSPDTKTGPARRTRGWALDARQPCLTAQRQHTCVHTQLLPVFKTKSSI